MLRRTLVISFGALAVAACGKSDADPAKPDASVAAAAAFMAKAAKEPGVKALPSGVLYKVVRSGPADGVSPHVGDDIKVHYECALTDGFVVDSSYQRGAPSVMPLSDGLIAAWVEVLPKMKPGDEWTVYVPPKEGYGERGREPVPPNAALVFRLELIAVLPTAGSTALG